MGCKAQAGILGMAVSRFAAAAVAAQMRPGDTGRRQVLMCATDRGTAPKGWHPLLAVELLECCRARTAGIHHSPLLLHAAASSRAASAHRCRDNTSQQHW
jgi:hypothetical protein